MILLDTNIVSAALVSEREQTVREWMNAHRVDALFICTPVLAELRFGVRLLPDGKRKERIAAIYDRLEDTLFARRILPFDTYAAHEYAWVRATRQLAGTPIMPMDALIAAIARANSMTLATRNTRDFEGLGITLVNPFEAKVR
jgi:predicted nucleic acid-binding protein